MPVFLNWLLRLLPTNPICLRLVQGGSRRLRHLYIRAGYLAVMIVVLLFLLLSETEGAARLSMRDLAGAGAQMFQIVSYLQVILICLLTPVFMAGAISQEANPKTWDILLTTPLNNIQLVLGNLFGRLFFVLALLCSSLPLFVMTQYFGGVPGNSIFASYAIAGASALIVASIAVTLSVTRTAGRRAVFLFYVSVVMYLTITYVLDRNLRVPIAPGASERFTTWLTPLNPFLALQVLLDSNHYKPHDFTGTAAGWLARACLSRPITTFCWLCVGVSSILMLFSTLRVRTIGASVGRTPLVRRMLGLPAKGATERPPRAVSRNPIAWRESVARGKTPAAIIGRWSFVAIGIAVALTLLGLFHAEVLDTETLRIALASVVAAEIVIIGLAALNMSATAVSREREDGTLDIILTTPIQPGPYIRGKHRGLFQYLVPMMSVPVVTLGLTAIYVLAGGFGRDVMLTSVAIRDSTRTVDELPMMLPEGAIILPLVLGPFIAFCVMVGLQWSIKSKGTIGAVIAAVGVVLAVVGVITLCGMPAGRTLAQPGAAMATFSPLNALFSIIYPAEFVPSAMKNSVVSARISLVVGAAVTAVIYTAIAYAMHSNMKRTFMMTVRRLAGAN